MFQFCCYMVCTLQDPGSVILIGSILLDKIKSSKESCKELCVLLSCKGSSIHSISTSTQTVDVTRL